MADEFDGTAALAEATGLPKSEILELWNEVRANRKKLNACPKHRFGSFVGTALRMKATCDNCGGTVPLSEAMIYADGYKAAGGNPDDVLMKAPG